MIFNNLPDWTLIRNFVRFPNWSLMFSSNIVCSYWYCAQIIWCGWKLNKAGEPPGADLRVIFYERAEYKRFEIVCEMIGTRFIRERWNEDIIEWGIAYSEESLQWFLTCKGPSRVSWLDGSLLSTSIWCVDLDLEGDILVLRIITRLKDIQCTDS